MFERDAGSGRQNQQRRESASGWSHERAQVDTPNSAVFFICQHFREHLDKLFAKGIGLLGEALAEAFTILSDVSSRTPGRAQAFTGFHGVINSFIWWFVCRKQWFVSSHQNIRKTFISQAAFVFDDVPARCALIKAADSGQRDPSIREACRPWTRSGAGPAPPCKQGRIYSEA